MKIKKSFFCIIERVDYVKGDEYKGKRTDIGHLLESKPKKKLLKSPSNKIDKQEVKIK